MNIFASYSDPVLCAEYLDDKRLVKMILETAQLLSTAVRVVNPEVENDMYEEDMYLYKSTHVNHPCSVWARASQSNFMWLQTHGLALCNRYTKIYKRRHKCHRLMIKIFEHTKLFPDIGLTPFPNCTTFNLGNVHLNYQAYLQEKWKTDTNRIVTGKQIGRAHV